MFFPSSQKFIILITHYSWHYRELLPARNSTPGSSTKDISDCSLEPKELAISSFFSPSGSNSCSYSLFLIIWICCMYLFSSPTFFRACRVWERLWRPCQTYLFLARRLTMCRLSSTFTMSQMRLRSTSAGGKVNLTSPPTKIGAQIPALPLNTLLNNFCQFHITN